ncbi:MAG: tungstate ABC transporter substrate-binding protein WtpA [Bacteroidetes bacterium]|nr:tungstate ABC transporter substrate-binding protein WtpA [Bacteroidota bacterium]
MKIISILLLLLLPFACANNLKKQDLIIFHAGSLEIPFAEIEKEFEKKYPNINVKRESSGSRTAAYKISDLKRKCDIMASADFTVINHLLIPDFADFNYHFTTNEMVILYREDSRYKNKLSRKNWFEILLKNNVEYGYSDPNTDPCGYRNLLVWQLAEKFYQKKGLYDKLLQGCPSKNIRPKATDLIALLEAKELDYLFIYKSVAIQHKKPYLSLPEKINLSNPQYNNFYQTASVNISGKTPDTATIKKGQSIIYGVTIPKNSGSKKAAKAFLDLLLSEEGKDILKKYGHKVV